MKIILTEAELVEKLTPLQFENFCKKHGYDKNFIASDTEIIALTKEEALEYGLIEGKHESL